MNSEVTLTLSLAEAATILEMLGEAKDAAFYGGECYREDCAPAGRARYNRLLDAAIGVGVKVAAALADARRDRLGLDLAAAAANRWVIAAAARGSRLGKARGELVAKARALAATLEAV